MCSSKLLTCERDFKFYVKSGVKDIMEDADLKLAGGGREEDREGKCMELLNLQQQPAGKLQQCWIKWMMNPVTTQQHKENQMM